MAKVFTKPYPDGFKNKPDKTTPITGEVMNAIQNGIADLEDKVDTLDISGGGGKTYLSYNEETGETKRITISAEGGLKYDSYTVNEHALLSAIHKGYTSDKGTVSASSELNAANPAWKAFDGTTGGQMWRSGAGIDGKGTAWIRYTFNQSCIFNSVYVLTGPNEVYDIAGPTDRIEIRVFVSGDWVLVADHKTKAQFNSEETIAFDDIEGSAVELRLYGTANSRRTISECRIYGKTTSNDLFFEITKDKIVTKKQIYDYVPGVNGDVSRSGLLPGYSGSEEAFFSSSGQWITITELKNKLGI